MKQILTRIQAVLAALQKLDRRIVAIFLVALMFVGVGTAAVISNSHQLLPITSTPLPMEITLELSLTPSPFPPELLENENQTIGPTIAASILILIVGVGVFNALRHRGPGDR